MKEKNKLVLSFILGAIIFGSITGLFAYAINASDTSFSPNDNTWNVNNVSSALDDLYTRASLWIDPSYIDFTTLATNTNKTMLLSSAGICIKRNNKVSCMKRDNWNVEKDHIQQIFSDVGVYNSNTGLGCRVDPNDVYCYASDFECHVNNNGFLSCTDKSNYSMCYVNLEGSVNCY